MHADRQTATVAVLAATLTQSALFIAQGWHGAVPNAPEGGALDTDTGNLAQPAREALPLREVCCRFKA